jgi:hypothetical protein
VPGLRGEPGGAGGRQRQGHHRGADQRGVEDPAETEHEVELHAHQRGEQPHASQRHPQGAVPRGGSFRLVGAVQGGRVLVREGVRSRQDAAAQQVGRLPVENERRGGRPSGLTWAPAVKVHGLARQSLVAAEVVEKGAHRRFRSGHHGGVQQILVRLLPVLLVNGLRLLTVDAEAALPADQQHVGDLRVHVVEAEVQVGSGEHLRFGLLPDQPQPGGDAREGHRGDQAEKDSHDHRHRGHPADAIGSGPPAEPSGDGGHPVPGRAGGRTERYNRDVAARRNSAHRCHATLYVPPARPWIPPHFR